MEHGAESKLSSSQKLNSIHFLVPSIMNEAEKNVRKIIELELIRGMREGITMMIIFAVTIHVSWMLCFVSFKDYKHHNEPLISLFSPRLIFALSNSTQFTSKKHTTTNVKLWKLIWKEEKLFPFVSELCSTLRLHLSVHMHCSYSLIFNLFTLAVTTLDIIKFIHIMSILSSFESHVCICKCV